MDKLGRKPLSVIDSIPYSEIILLVTSGKNYPLSIAEARGRKDSSPTAKQLKQLEDKGFLLSSKEKLLNKTIYQINWKRINQDFIKEVEEMIYERVKESKTTIDSTTLDFKKTIINTNYYSKNKLLSKLLSYVFIGVSKSDDKPSLKSIFRMTALTLGIEGILDEMWKMIDINKAKKETAENSQLLQLLTLQRAIRMSNINLSIMPYVRLGLREIFEENNLPIPDKLNKDWLLKMKDKYATPKEKDTS